uniref:Uncharacterized protein n=1 Tax=Rhizophora mucronata TaxID=61149 RepID=A0A2P2JUC6_RHIMU
MEINKKGKAEKHQKRRLESQQRFESLFISMYRV